MNCRIRNENFRNFFTTRSSISSFNQPSLCFTILVELLLQLSAARHQIFNQQRLAFDARQDSRHDNVRRDAKQTGSDYHVKRDVERGGK